MKTAFWAGPNSVKGQVLRDHFDSLSTKEKFFSSVRQLNGRQDPQLIISEDLEALNTYSHQYPSAHQIYICRSTELIDSFHTGVRPIQRYFFLMDTQTNADFVGLVKFIDEGTQPLRRRNHQFSPIPSMQNSLEVLRRITEDRLFELRNFSHEEEERRKNFRSLIHLARCLSMSHDIEEVVHYLWNDLRQIDGLHGISFVISDPSGATHQIVTKSGKFHFEEISNLTDQQLDFLAILHTTHRYRDLAHLAPLDTDSVHFLFRRPLKNPYLQVIPSDSSNKTFFLFLETEQSWKKTDTFDEYLRERLSFINLTLEKHILQEEIKAKANLWAATFDNLQDPLAIITQKRTVVRSNRQFQNTKGQICHQVWANSKHSCSACPKTVIDPTTFELQIDQKIYQSSLYPIYESDQYPPYAFVSHYVDVTTERILYSRLIQSEKMIAVGKLAGDLSQALSFPLKKIIQITDRILQTSNLNSQAQSDLTEIRRASHRSLRIIEDFENFSAGRVEKELVMAETVVEKTVPLIKALIHGHRFNIQLSELKHPIRGSLSLLQQVLYNLLRNAHQSMKSHGELRITTESRTIGTTDGVQISVIDSGAGLSEELRLKIFQPFVTTKTSSEGTGLGLNIVKQIVENHYGKVGYEPRPEGGSKFWIWIPLAKDSLK